MKIKSVAEFAKELEVKIESELTIVESSHDDFLQTGAALGRMREMVYYLKELVRTYQFRDQQEEIQFFKKIKPALVSKYIYCETVATIQIHISYQDQERRTGYCESILRRLERFANRNEKFIRYYLSGRSDLDHYYFVRQRFPAKSLSIDAAFTTGYDMKLSKILAHEMITKYVRSANKSQQGAGLTWTGSKTDLIELIYALHSVGVFNGGSADLKQIADCFASVFKIGLGNYYRVFQDIRNRKTGQTLFIDQIKSKFIHKMAESD